MSYIFFAVVIVITVVFQMVTRSRKGKNNER